MSASPSSSNAPFDAKDSAQVERLAAFERGEIDAEAAGLVHFSRACWVETEVVYRAYEFAWIALLTVPALAAIAALVMRRVMPTVSKVVFILVVLTVAIFPLVEVARFLWKRGRREAEALSEATDATPNNDARVCYCGTRGELAAVGELRNVPFEPFICPLVVPPVAIRNAGVRSFATGIALTVILCALCAAVGIPIDWGNVILLVCFGGAIGAPVARLIWPTHLRITPGLVEIIEYGPFKVQPVAITRLEVATRPLIVDLRRRVLLFDVGGKRLDISFAWTRDPACIAFFMLLSAVSTHRASNVSPEEPT